ncbi:UDP-N-acetylmuramoyl-tripeptide--D-alanyl-D-alanine ligase [Candidatus Roizmanbacteria bacterium]|nr:UDP-N-acetylmuramoyl-tripeptide--D-alanyl-D-alanine ligase [Candidatus Roizmanbacteria bacterium]
MIYNPPFYKRLFHSTRRFLAKHWLSLMPATQIAITGSQGKTITTRVISNVLSSIGPTVVTDVNLDTIYNVPITAVHVTPWTKFAVFELGIDQPNEMDFHLEIVKPTIGVITGISPVHTDKEHLGSLENLVKEKRKLIEALPQNGYAILNYDDVNVRNMAAYTKAKILWYGTDPKQCDVWADPASVKVSLKGTEFKLTSRAKSRDKNDIALGISTKLIGRHHIYTIMAAFLVYKTVSDSTDFNRFQQILTDLTPLLGRMGVERGPLDTIILNDSLRANPTSTAAGLKTLSQIYHQGKKIAVLAEMGELENPEEEHKKIGKLLSPLAIDVIIGIGPQQQLVINELNKYKTKKIAFYAKDVYDAAEILKKIIKNGDLIYLKGSLFRHVERVLHILEGKKPPPDLILETNEIKY